MKRLVDIKIIGKSGTESRRVKGEMFGKYLAVTPSGRQWSVTHVPTGMAIVTGLIREKCVRVAEEVEPMTDWGKITSQQEASAVPGLSGRIAHVIWITRNEKAAGRVG